MLVRDPSRGIVLIDIRVGGDVVAEVVATGVERIGGNHVGDAKTVAEWVEATGANDIFTAWPRIVGEQVAANATPVRLEKRVLTVEVTDNAWATQLKFLERQVLHTLREHAGDVVDSITVRVRRSR